MGLKIFYNLKFSTQLSGNVLKSVRTSFILTSCHKLLQFYVIQARLK